MTELWTATVTMIGPDVAEMRDAGVIILFADPVPPALAEVSIVHTGGATPTRPIGVGDRFVLDGAEVEIRAIGEIANENLTELGHVVIYLNQDEDKVLPGAIHAAGELGNAAEGSVLKFVGQ